MSEPMDVAALVKLAQHGDAQAFSLLIDPLTMRLHLLIRRYGGRALGADCDAEDLLQVVLARAWNLLPTFEYLGQAALYGWLAALSKRAVDDRRKYLAAKGRGGVGHVESAQERGGLQVYDPRTSVSKVVARREEFDQADEALQRLDEKYRVVVEAHLLEGKPLSEIARELGKSKNAVWERYHRGMKHLSSALRPLT